MEYQVSRDVKLRVDTQGNVTLMQVNTLVNPEIAVSTINLSASGADKLVVTLTEAIRAHDAKVWTRRRVG